MLQEVADGWHISRGAGACWWYVAVSNPEWRPAEGDLDASRFQVWIQSRGRMVGEVDILLDQEEKAASTVGLSVLPDSCVTRVVTKFGSGREFGLLDRCDVDCVLREKVTKLLLFADDPIAVPLKNVKRRGS